MQIKKYDVPVNLLRKIPAINEPNKLTIRVDAGTPIIVYSKVLTKYLREAPIIAPVKRAR